MAKIEKPELKNQLEHMIELLQKQGLLPDVDKSALAERVSEKLVADNDVKISSDDVKNNPDIRKALGLACIAECNPKNTFNYSILFKNTLEMSSEYEKELTKEIKDIFKEMLKLNPKLNINEEKLEEIAKKAAEHFMKENDQFLPHNEKLFGMFAAILDLMLRKQEEARLGPSPEKKMSSEEELYLMMYGTTGKQGEVRLAVQGQPVGDQLGILNLSLGQGESFEAAKIRPSDGFDPLGIDFASVVLNLQDGVETALETKLGQLGVIPRHITPTPPGTPNV